MLKQRLLTAAVLGGVTVMVIVSGSNIAFMVLLGVCITIAAWEWAGLCGQKDRRSQMIYAATLIVMGTLIIFAFPEPWLNGFILSGAIWWLLASLMVAMYAAGKYIIPQSRLLKYIMGMWVLLPVAVSLIVLYGMPHGPFRVMWLFVLVWAVDTAAYFTGRRWGKRRLAPRVSPGKTWEGLAGSLLAAVIIALAGAWMSHNKGITAAGLVLLFIVVTIFSVMGDLFESMFKRESNLKDSSQLLPGHGGVLDRIDSLTAAAPVYVIGLWLLEAR